MTVRNFINIEEIEKFYCIEEDGAVWSNLSNKYLKPTFNTAGYLHVAINIPRTSATQERNVKLYAVHRLVACKYIGQCPIGKETSHRDGDKQNNHYSNLEYTTHSENILKSFREHGRTVPEWKRNPFSDFTKELMSNAKKVKVLFVSGRKRVIFDSIEDAAAKLKTYRRKIYRCIKFNLPFKEKNNPETTGTLSYYIEKRETSKDSRSIFAL